MSLVEAARYYNSFEAGLAQSRLEEAGLDSVLFDLEMASYGAGRASRSPLVRSGHGGDR